MTNRNTHTTPRDQIDEARDLVAFVENVTGDDAELELTAAGNRGLLLVMRAIGERLDQASKLLDPQR